MVTPVLGDRDSKTFTVYQALDQAFVNRISRCFDSLCDTFEDDQAVTCSCRGSEQPLICGTLLRPRLRQNTRQGWPQPSCRLREACEPGPEKSLSVAAGKSGVASANDIYALPVSGCMRACARSTRLPRATITSPRLAPICSRAGPAIFAVQVIDVQPKNVPDITKREG
jgi:hypothetical protein